MLEQLNFENKIFFTIIVLIVINLMRYLQQWLITYWIFCLIGTILHELMHYIISLITNGKPTKLSIKPVKVNDYYILGSVSSINLRWYNAFVIAFAPLLLIPFLFIINHYFFIYFTNTILNNLFYIYLIITILEASIPSSQDFRVAFRYSFVPILVIVGGLCIYYFI